MRFTVLSVLSLVGVGMVSALPQESSLTMKRGDTSNKCVGPLLCCGTLATPLDPVVDSLLLALGIDAANIVGAVGLLCHGYDDSCPSAPQCCTEANLLGGTLALGCSDY
ncbi:Hydrophobin [Penicillium sp. DV-2018c]|nr:Hydrophobin [Penicillium sp. DV-2018c]